MVVDFKSHQHTLSSSQHLRHPRTNLSAQICAHSLIHNGEHAQTGTDTCNVQGFTISQRLAHIWLVFTATQVLRYAWRLHEK